METSNTCTIALWRGVTAAQPAGWEEVLEKGLIRLNGARTSEGKWRGYSFYYTLLTLADIDSPAARQEQSHVAKAVESLLKRNRGDDRKHPVTEYFHQRMEEVKNFVFVGETHVVRESNGNFFLRILHFFLDNDQRVLYISINFLTRSS